MTVILSTLSAIALWVVALFGSTLSYSAPVTAILHPSAPEATVIFGGDMMFDRTVRTAMEQRGGDFIFSCIDPVLQSADAVVANLEGPITSTSSVSQFSSPGDSHNFTFTFDPSTASLLYRHGIRIVSLGNNHILNFGREGLVETKHYLEEARVAYFGDPDAPEAQRVLRTEISGVPFSFVNWSDWTSDKTDHTVAQVREEALAGRVVVVYAHWGEEYVPPPARVRALAHQFADAGAVIVIGSHPHIVQEHELYRGVPIYYSLGNFIFDQYFSDAVRHGLLLRVTFDADGVAGIEELPIELNHDRATCLTPTPLP